MAYVQYQSCFDKSRVAKFNGPMNRGVLKAMQGSEAKANRIRGLKFVNTIENKGKPPSFVKSWFVV